MRKVGEARRGGGRFCPRGRPRCRGLHGEGGIEECSRNIFGHRIGNADGEFSRARVGAELDGIEKLAAEGEDVICILVDELADFGKYERAAAAFEEAIAEHVLELMDLGGDGGAGEMEFFGRARARRPPSRGDPCVHEIHGGGGS